MELTNKEKRLIAILQDPVMWAKHHLGEEPRWYQERILRHPHNRKVLRCGRRIGKCVSGTSKILNTETGEYLSIEEMYRNKIERIQVPSLNESHFVNESELFSIEKNGEQKTVKVVLESGKELSLTLNHPLLTLDGWVEAGDLIVGESIATPKILPHFGDKSFSEDKLELLAILTSMAKVTYGKVRISNRKKEKLDDAVKKLEAAGIKLRKVENFTYQLESMIKPESMRSIANVEIPNIVYQLDKESLALFLKHLYEKKGYTVRRHGREDLHMTSGSKTYLLAVHHLLLRFGIHSAVLEKQRKNMGHSSPYYEIVIYRNIGYPMFQQEILKEEVSKEGYKEDTFPIEIWKDIYPLMQEKGVGLSSVKYNRTAKRTTRLKRSELYSIALELNDRKYLDLAESNVLYEKIIRIEEPRTEETYDVFVPTQQNYVANDVITHNTWTMIAHMLWVAYTCNGGTETKRGATCLVATPYDSQAREIFDQLIVLIKNNKELESAVAATRKSPYEIEFRNKSRIKLFTVGTKSGAEGGSLRGQKAS